MHRRKVALLLFTLLLIASLVAEVRAQAVYGSISGTVTDSQGAVVPDATVTITSTERNTSDTVQTNDSGLYVKDRLLPGTYKVTIEKAGYKQGLIASVVVNVDTQAKTDVTLEAGQVTETVTISATEGQLLKTDRADVATTFESRQVTDLPILDRNFTKLILLTPGTTQLAWNHAASENPQGSTQTQVNGQHFSGTGWQLDGTENRDPILGIIVINPTFESIGETKITSQNYDAEFGQAIAGVATVQTKSGTNDFHGSLFAFRQNDLLQARNPFTQFQKDPLTGKAVPDTLKTQFGGSIGGRIIRDKLFFFTDYQGRRSKVGGSKLLSVPTAKARAGDLSEYGTPIFDPTTGTPDSSAGRQQFAGNIIPSNRLSPQALNLLSLLPLPNAPGRNNGTTDNFVSSGSEGFDSDQYDVRIDGRISEKLNLFGRYSYAKFTLNGPPAFGAGGGPELVSLGGTSKSNDHSLALGFDYTLTSTTILDVRFGFFRYKVNVLPFDFGQATSQEAGIPGLNLDDFSSGLSGMDVSGPIGAIKFGSGLDINRCNCPLDQNEKQYQLVTNLTKLVGNHTVKFGVDFRRAINLRVPSDAHRSGLLFYNQQRTAGPVSGSGLGLATFLLGDVTSFRRYVSPTLDAGERQWRHFYYGQDTWRITPKITLAYGLRLDVINPQTASGPEKGGIVRENADLVDRGVIQVAGVAGIPLNGGIENSYNLAPRFGIAYQLNDKTVIRAGYGRSYDIGVFGSIFGHNITQNLPVLAVQALSPTNDFARVFTLAQGPTPVTFAPVPANGLIPIPNGISQRILPDKQRLPAVDAWNVTVQHQLRNDISIEAAYVGNKGTHAFVGDDPSLNINQVSPVGFGTLSANQRKPFFQKFGLTQDLPYYCNCGDNRYNALQTKLTKRFSNGYSVLTHYTWQRTTNNLTELFTFPGFRDLNRGPNDYDRTHVFVLSQVGELPFGRGKRYFSNSSRAMNLFTGGWQINSNTTIMSGLPFNTNFNRNSATELDTGPNRPNLTGDPHLGAHRRSDGQIVYFDPTAFSVPAAGTYGNLKRNSLRGPGYWRTDASLFKKFFITETTDLEFRIEVQNLFNHVNLGQPNGAVGRPGVGTIDPNAGVINSLAFQGNSTEPTQQRNVQFALKLKF